MQPQVKDVAENPLAKQGSGTRGDTSSGNMETRLLENSINKICSLLAIGFGDAGGQVRGRTLPFAWHRLGHGLLHHGTGCTTRESAKRVLKYTQLCTEKRKSPLQDNAALVESMLKSFT